MLEVLSLNACDFLVSWFQLEFNLKEFLQKLANLSTIAWYKSGSNIGSKQKPEQMMKCFLALALYSDQTIGCLLVSVSCLHFLLHMHLG